MHRLLLTDTGDELFAKLTQLTQLNVLVSPRPSAIYLRGRDTLSFSCLVNLKELIIEKAPPTVYLHLRDISALTKLECGQWEDEIMALSQLQKLDIASCRNGTFSDKVFCAFDYPCVELSELSNLASLCIGFSAYQPVHFTKLLNLPALNELRLNIKSYNKTAHPWQQLAALSQLQRLYVSERVPTALLNTVVSMKQLVSLVVSANCVPYDWESALPGLQSMSCLEHMSWYCAVGTFPASLLSLANTMMKDGNLQGFVVEDKSGVYVA